jgi:hypothetical protein
VLENALSVSIKSRVARSFSGQRTLGGQIPFSRVANLRELLAESEICRNVAQLNPSNPKLETESFKCYNV